ncbi:hypothetical protein KIPB_006601, partial [Kipferlia bialata]
PEHRNPDNSKIKGYDQLGEYAWERMFLTLPCQDYRQHNSDSKGEVSHVFMRNTYIAVTTNLSSTDLMLPLHWTTSAALEAGPVPVTQMNMNGAM